MIYLFLSILSSSSIFLIFKLTERFKTNLFKLITINYLIAALLGFGFNQQQIQLFKILTSSWLFFALLIGLLFIVMFFLIGHSIRTSGMAVTTIAAKMSMVIPILFSVVFFSEKANLLKTSGLTLAVFAVFMSIYKPITQKSSFKLIFLPLAIFIGSGITDSLVKYAQTYFVHGAMSLLFSSFVFLTALLIGILYLIFSKRTDSKTITLAELIGGTFLGIANFGSLHFFILALNNSKLESSVIFGLNNLFIVLLSVILGASFFQEKLSKINFAGVIAAFVAILILMNY